MRIYGKDNVLEAARKRFEWIYKEFGKNVVISTSGGKDSSVCFHLALEAARKTGNLPIKVMFIDQEAEWQAAIDSVRYMMEHPDVEPYWLQVPFRLFNATSVTDHWLQCWDPADEEKWMRPKESYAITENNFGTDRFHKLFSRAIAKLVDGPCCSIGGVRASESPNRSLALTCAETYKGVTWGSRNFKEGNYTFYPIYDWDTSDVWKYIHENNFPYCKLYDQMYQYGLPILKMRVSNVHHEMAVGSLFYLQEIEPETYVRLCNRIAGIDMAAKMGSDDYFPKKLPASFSDWTEYREYLLKHLITDSKWNAAFRRKFDMLDFTCGSYRFSSQEALSKVAVTSILTNDWEGLILANYKISFTREPERKEYYEAKMVEYRANKKESLTQETQEYELTEEDEREFDGSI